MTSSDSKTHKLWGGRFGAGPAAAFDALNNSIGVDFRLWPHDVKLSQAWAQGLVGAQVLAQDEADTLVRGLDAVAASIEGGARPMESDEDIHTMIDRLLHAEVGDVASKLHTGRSRNDQVATATRLYTMDVCSRLDAAVRELQQVMVGKAEASQDLLMPAYTHMQRAIPVSAAHWMLAHFWPLQRDRARIDFAKLSSSVMPLGSGAVAGCAYPISRDALCDALGFAAPSPNSIDAVSDRDFVAEVLFACTMLGTHLSRLAEDLIIYGSSEFGFVQFGDSFTSGSSMMPQKRNPDALELARQSAARMLGNLVTVITTLKGLPTSYNKDLQDDKRPLFDATDTLLLVLPAVSGALAECTFRAERMKAALSSTMMATDLADYLVRKGATFREAHSAVGQLVREAEVASVELSALPASSFAAAHGLFGADVGEALSAARSVSARAVHGATGPGAVADQLVSARAALG